jgi:hypothetical protein
MKRDDEKYIVKDRRAVTLWWASVQRCLEIHRGLDLCDPHAREVLAKELALCLSQEGLGVHHIEDGLIYRGRPTEGEKECDTKLSSPVTTS